MSFSKKTILVLYVFLVLFSIKAQGEKLSTKAYPLSSTQPFEYYLLKHQDYLLRNIDSSGYYLDLAEKKLSYNNLIENMLFLYHKSNYNYRTSSNFDDVIKDCEKGLEIANKLNYHFYQVKFHMLIAVSSSRDENQVYKHNQKAYDIAKLYKMDHELALVVFNTLAIERANGNLDYVQKNLIQIRPKLKSAQDRIRYYILFALTTQDVDETLMYIDSGEVIARANNYKIFQEHFYAQKADLYRKHCFYSEALECFYKIDSLHIRDLGNSNIHQYSFVRSKLHYDLGEYNQAKKYFDIYRASQYGNVVKLGSQQDYYAYELHKSLKESSKALKYLENWASGMEKKNEVFRDSLYQVYRAQFELDKTQSDLIIKDSQIKLYRMEIIFLILGFIILLLITFIVYRIRYLKKQKEIIETNLRFSNEKKVNEIRKRFVENITHEINTPVTLIKGVFESSLRDNNYDQELMEIGLKNATQLTYDMQQILKFLKTNSTIAPVINQELILLPFFLEIINKFKINLSSKGLVLIFTYNFLDNSYLLSDKNKLATILSNYLSNAIKFSNTATEIHINAFFKNSEFVFSVKDFGYSLTQSELPFVFDRFFRGENNKENIGGHGIGLSICRELSELLDGKVYAELNDQEKSTSFYFKKVIDFTPNIIEEKRIEFKEQINLHLKNVENSTKKKILLVDDNELMLSFYKKVLSPYYVCDYAYNGIEAIEKLKEGNQYDCLILDVMMPKMDGLELLKSIKESNDFRDLPSIFITAKNFQETRNRAFNLGVHDFISKPFVLQELLVRIENVIRNNKSYKNEKLVSINIESNNESIEQTDPDFIQKTSNIIYENIGDESFSVEQLASLVFYSKRQLGRKVKNLTGLTPRELILEIRLRKAYEILKSSQSLRINEIQRIIGIKSTTYFYKSFKERFGVSPNQVRNQTNNK